MNTGVAYFFCDCDCGESGTQNCDGIYGIPELSNACGSCGLTLPRYHSDTAADQGPRLIYKAKKLTTNRGGGFEPRNPLPTHLVIIRASFCSTKKIKKLGFIFNKSCKVTTYNYF